MSRTDEHEGAQPRLNMFTVVDPGLWEFRSQLSGEEFAIPDVPDEEWETFHAILAEVRPR